MDKLEYRAKMDELNTYMVDKSKSFMAYFHMRDGYYRGISVDSQKTVDDMFPTLNASDVKLESKEK